MTFLQRIPYPPLILFSLVLGLAPFAPQPHLLEKIRMLLAGGLTRPLDLFDLLFHLAPALLLFGKWWAERRAKTSGSGR